MQYCIFVTVSRQLSVYHIDNDELTKYIALKISCRKEKDERKKLKEGELKAIKHQNEKLEAELRDIKKMLMAMRPTAWVQPLRLNTTESITI